MGKKVNRHIFLGQILMNTTTFLNENGDISAFKDVEALRIYIEPIDVQNNEYQVFCSDGTRLATLVQNGEVQIQSTNEKVPDELLELINNFFQGTKPVIGKIPTLDLAVSAFVENFGFCE